MVAAATRSDERVRPCTWIRRGDRVPDPEVFAAAAPEVRLIPVAAFLCGRCRHRGTGSATGDGWLSLAARHGPRLAVGGVMPELSVGVATAGPSHTYLHPGAIPHGRRQAHGPRVRTTVSEVPPWRPSSP